MIKEIGTRETPFVRHVLTVVLIAVLAGLFHIGTFKNFDDKFEATRAALAPRAPSNELLFVTVDTKSLVEIGVWPWKRGLHAQLIDKLLAAGASEIVFDVDFSLPSIEAEDAKFEAALKRADGSVILPTFRQPWTDGSRSSGNASNAREHLSEPLPRFAPHVWLSSVNVYPDSDGVVRSMPYSDIVKDELRPTVPSLMGNANAEAGSSFKIDWSINPKQIPRISYVDILNDKFERENVAGRKIMVGSVASELRDNHRVPVHGLISGAEIQLVAAETLLQNRVIQPMSPWQIATVLGAGLFLLFLTTLANFSRRGAIVAGLFLSSSVEIVAFALYKFQTVDAPTTTVHIGIISYVLLRVFLEIGIAKYRLFHARIEASNSKSILDRVIEDNIAGIVLIKDDGSIISVNSSASEILGAGKRKDHAGTDLTALLPPEFATLITEAMERYGHGNDESSAIDLCTVQTKGSTRLFEYSLSRSNLDPGESGRDIESLFSLTFTDVTARERTKEKLTWHAERDPLTGLYNRRATHRELKLLTGPDANGETKKAVLYIDLDRFKSINDSLGHRLGDEMLRVTAQRARQILSDRDFLARLGGDEFVAIVQCDNFASVKKLAEKLIEKLSVEMAIDRTRATIGISIGIAEIDVCEADPFATLSHADTALYEAKRAGGNCCRVFDADMKLKHERRVRLEHELLSAREEGQLELHFQPQKCLRTGNITGAETLMRWNHPELGKIPPDEFIPIAERIGLIIDIGEWAIREACCLAANWPADIRVAINVSAKQFEFADITGQIRKGLDESGLDPARLDVEITESVLVISEDIMKHTLSALHDLGVTISLDDFGTGYSALSYLRKFDIDKVKIDRSFIVDIAKNTEALVMVAGIINMVSTLGMKVIAEGIETETDETLLRSVQCDEGQGYYIARAMPNGMFEEFLRKSGTAKYAGKAA